MEMKFKVVSTDGKEKILTYDVENLYHMMGIIQGLFYIANEDMKVAKEVTVLSTILPEIGMIPWDEE